MSLTAILDSAVLIEAQVSSLRSKMMMNFTPGCLFLQITNENIISFVRIMFYVVSDLGI